MTFAPLSEVLAACVRQPWAIGGYDTANLEITQAIVDAAVAERSPLILMLYPGHVPARDWPGVVAMIEGECRRADVPVALQMDHCKNIEQVAWAIRLGFSAVMVDGSALPFEQNVALSRQAVDLCHPLGISVEAELGHVGYSNEEISAGDALARLTRVDEAVRFVKETEVDALAVAVGTIHGLYRGKPEIDFDRIRALREALDLPLVVHGGSDTPDADIRAAIDAGLDKINIWTDLRLAYLQASKAVLDVTPLETCRVEQVSDAARHSVCRAVQQKIRLFGSNNQC